MRYVLAFVLVLSMVGTAAAYDLGNAMPEKTDVYPDYVNPEVRQGGDTIDTATVIDALPFDDVGTTAGYTNDYDEVCPYSLSTSPDVVYSFTPGMDVAADIDLCGSAYDTKLYVYDSAMNLVACNDDYYFDDICGVYVSFLGGVAMMAGETYFIVIDGYGGDAGDYLLAVSENVPCVVECPPEGFPENEPDLVDGYVDDWNGGCNSNPPYPFQSLNFGPSFVDFCGVAGWYMFDGSNYRDTDWFTAIIGENGYIELTADAESATNIFELAIEGDCASITVTQSMTVGACAPGTLTVFGAPFTMVYLWAGSANFANPGDVVGNMYDYLLTLDGLEGSANEASTWSQVKGLYR